MAASSIKKKVVVSAPVQLSGEESNLNHNEWKASKADKYGDAIKEAQGLRQMHAFKYFYFICLSFSFSS